MDRRIRGTGGDRVYFYDDDGRLESIPVAWTDLAAEDPFVVVSAGRACFRVEDLLRLRALIDSWTNPAPRVSAQRKEGVR